MITFDVDDPDQDLLIRQLKAEPNPGSATSGGLGDDGSDALEGGVDLVLCPRDTLTKSFDLGQD